MRPQQTLFLTVAEPEGQIFFGRDDLLRYAGPSQLIASALVLRLLAQAFADLSPGQPPLRSDIHVLTAFPGDGILDCVELVTRARTQDRLSIDTEAGPPEAPPALPGRFYFEVRIGARARAYWPRDGFFSEEFRQRVTRFQEGAGSAAELDDYLAYKHALIGRLLGAPAGQLFHSKELSA